MLASFWHKVPFARFLLPFCIGIAFGIAFKASLFISLLLFAILLLATIACAYLIHAFSKQWITGIFLNFSLFAAGAGLNAYQYEPTQASHFNRMHAQFLAIKVSELPTVKKAIRFTGQVIAIIDSSDQTQPATGKIMVFVKRDSLLPALHYGQIILCRNRSRPVPGPMNPGEFDYAAYLALKHVHQQLFLSAADFIVTATEDKNPFLAFAFNCQEYFSTALKQYVVSPRETAVAKALIFGYDDDIDDELVQGYAHTGTLHVLAVSGMHVGMIFLVLELLLGFSNKKWFRLLKSVLVLLLIWTYSLVCGLSPSILRASVMISFVVLGRLLKRPQNVYNSLAASAFFILLYDSNTLVNAGFQLSYLAVAGIVFLGERISSLILFENRFADAAWKLAAVSLAAQLGTFPIGLFYFKQFPNLFLVSNLLVIPLTSMVIYVGILLLLVSPIAMVATYVGIAMKWGIWLCDEIVLGIEKLPYSYSNLQVSWMETCVLYLMLAAFITLFIERQGRYLLMGLSCIIALLLINGNGANTQVPEDKIIVYKVPKHQVIACFKSQQCFLLSDAALDADKKSFNFHVAPSLSPASVVSISRCALDSGNSGIVRFGEKQLLILRPVLPRQLPRSVDVLYVCSNNQKHIEQVLQQSSAAHVIFDIDLPRRLVNQLKKLCAEKHLPFHSISEQGAFQLSLPR